MIAYTCVGLRYAVYVRPLVEHNSSIWSPCTLKQSSAFSVGSRHVLLSYNYILHLPSLHRLQFHMFHFLLVLKACLFLSQDLSNETPLLVQGPEIADIRHISPLTLLLANLTLSRRHKQRLVTINVKKISWKFMYWSSLFHSVYNYTNTHGLCTLHTITTCDKHQPGTERVMPTMHVQLQYELASELLLRGKHIFALCIITSDNIKQWVILW